MKKKVLIIGGKCPGLGKTLAEEIAKLRLSVVTESVCDNCEQLPPNSITDKEHEDLMKALYPKDNSKRFRR